jgi:hypothetical protein
MALVGRESLEAALAALGELLATRGYRYEVVVVGGGNLILRDLIARPTTKDIDLLGIFGPDGIQRMPALPEPFRTAISDVARVFGLADDWVNLGPASLLDLGLPDGFRDRLERRDYEGLVVWLAGRFDMICFKLYAAADQTPRSRHFQDLEELEPSLAELQAAARWTGTHDPSPAYRDALVRTLAALGWSGADDALD